MNRSQFLRTVQYFYFFSFFQALRRMYIFMQRWSLTAASTSFMTILGAAFWTYACSRSCLSWVSLSFWRVKRSRLSSWYQMSRCSLSKGTLCRIKGQKLPYLSRESSSLRLSISSATQSVITCFMFFIIKLFSSCSFSFARCSSQERFLSKFCLKARRLRMYLLWWRCIRFMFSQERQDTQDQTDSSGTLEWLGAYLLASCSTLLITVSGLSEAFREEQGGTRDMELALLEERREGAGGRRVAGRDSISQFLISTWLWSLIWMTLLARGWKALRVLTLQARAMEDLVFRSGLAGGRGFWEESRSLVECLFLIMKLLCFTFFSLGWLCWCQAMAWKISMSLWSRYSSCSCLTMRFQFLWYFLSSLVWVSRSLRSMRAAVSWRSRRSRWQRMSSSLQVSKGAKWVLRQARAESSRLWRETRWVACLANLQTRQPRRAFWSGGSSCCCIMREAAWRKADRQEESSSCLWIRAKERMNLARRKCPLGWRSSCWQSWRMERCSCRMPWMLPALHRQRAQQTRFISCSSRQEVLPLHSLSFVGSYNTQRLFLLKSRKCSNLFLNRNWWLTVKYRKASFLVLIHTAAE